MIVLRKCHYLKPSPADRRYVYQGPESLFAIAVGNILDNALKYGSGLVDIEVQSDANQNIVITVKDCGPGIPENTQHQAFQRFYRINTDTTKGFGLGLALVQQIMKALDGDVQMANRLPLGLSVTLTLPVLNLE